MYDNVTAPYGQVFVCLACGKWSRTWYGDAEAQHYGWDESCFLNSALCYENKLQRNAWKKITRILDGAMVNHEVNDKWCQRETGAINGQLDNYWAMVREHYKPRAE